VNQGPAADFSAKLKAKGFENWPDKDVFGLWDRSSEFVRKIPKSTTERLRIAWELDQIGTRQWRAFLVTDTGMQQRDSLKTTVYGSVPLTDEWFCQVEFEVSAVPDLSKGPIRGAVQLHGDGRVAGTIAAPYNEATTDPQLGVSA
jgi:hypothetical protein